MNDKDKEALAVLAQKWREDAKCIAASPDESATLNECADELESTLAARKQEKDHE